MTRSIENLRAFGDMDTDVFTGKLGTPFAGTAAAAKDPGEDFPDLGWLTEDGGDEAFSVDSTTFNMLQGGFAAKVKATALAKTMTVTGAETNPHVLALYYALAEAPTTTGLGDAAVTKIVIPKGARTIARAGLFKFTEGDIWWVRHNTRVEISDRGNVTYANGDLAARQFTFNLVGEDAWYTNDPAFTGLTADDWAKFIG